MFNNDFHEKWVECLNCSYEYVIDHPMFEHKGCPVCSSHTFEESNNTMDWGE